jgi:hypothetical protein
MFTTNGMSLHVTVRIRNTVPYFTVAQRNRDGKNDIDSEFHDNNISQAVTLPPLVSSTQVVIQSTPEVFGIVA